MEYFLISSVLIFFATLFAFLYRLMKSFSSFPVLVQDIQRQLFEVSKISNLLVNPAGLKTIGEKNLEFLLQDILPKEYVLVQHEIPGIGIVDTALKFNDRILPIDSKFPKYNENKKEFERAIKDRIKEASKYAVPNKGTTDFVLMFVCSELIYNKAFIENDELLKFAWLNNVVPVSPGMLYPYLVVIADLKLKDNLDGKDVVDNIKVLYKDFEEIKTSLNRANKQSRDSINNIEASLLKMSDSVNLLKKMVGL